MHQADQKISPPERSRVLATDCHRSHYFCRQVWLWYPSPFLTGSSITNKCPLARWMFTSPGLASEDDPLRRAPGEALWLEMYPRERLLRIRAGRTPYYWQSLYQQNPQEEGGTEWPDAFFGDDFWFDQWPKAWRLKCVALGPDGIGVEVHQFQQLLADELQRVSQERGMPLPLYTINNQVNKQVRIRRLTPYLAQKLLRFKGGSPGARLLVEQLRDFPCGDHDDGPDALEMAVRMAEGMFAEAARYNEPPTYEVWTTPDPFPWR